METLRGGSKNEWYAVGGPCYTPDYFGILPFRTTGDIQFECHSPYPKP